MSPYMVTNIPVYIIYISQSQKKNQESKGNRKLDIYKCPFLETQKKFQKTVFFHVMTILVTIMFSNLKKIR